MIVSAHLITRTRDCAAQGCTLDAEPGLEFCWRCILKPIIRRHETPEIYTGPTLRCCCCGVFKPDESFNKQNQKCHDRRGRHQECRECCAQRRRDTRARMTSEERATEAAKQRRRRQALRAAQKASLGWPPV